MRLKRGIAALAAIMLWAAPALGAQGEPAPGHGSWLLFVFYVINFAIFCWVVWYADRYMGGFTGGYFRGRNRAIRETITRADSAFKDAQELADRAGARLTDLPAERRRLSDEIDGETSFMIKRIREVGQASAERTRRDGAQTATALAQASRRRIRERMAAAAIAMARELLERNFEPADQSRLLDGFVEELGQQEAAR